MPVKDAVSFTTFALALLLFPGAASANERTCAREVSSDPLILSSPLDPLPVVREEAREMALPFPPTGLPMAAPSYDRGVGTMTLVAEVKDGWLVGTNAGEWIGTLAIERSSGRKILAKGNVLGGFMWHGRLYILSGLDHLLSNEGELWEVDLEAERLVRRTRLPAAPMNIVITKNEELVVRTKNGDVMLLNSGAIVDCTRH